MDIVQLVILSAVQGVTEFLPISSSGHLIIMPRIMDWKDQGLAIDIAMHIGTLMAVILYFRKDVLTVLAGGRDLMIRKDSTDDTRLFLNLVIATVPVVFFGFLMKNLIENGFRHVELVAATSIVFGLVLYFADKGRAHEKVIPAMPPYHALLIGMAQTLALVPGVSRSGITMTAALFLGYSRTDSARFSLLLSIPVTFAAGALIVYEMVAETANETMVRDAVIAGVLAFVFAYLAIVGMMSWLQKFSFTPFVIYRVMLGIVLLLFFA